MAFLAAALFDVRLGFDRPAYLMLLVLLPLLGWGGYRALAALGPGRRGLALSLRLLVVFAIVLALAGAQIIWVNDRVTVVYLLDQSDSIAPPQRRQMLQYTVASVRQHRDAAREDLAGVIVFGREAAIEVPPFAEDLLPQRDLDHHWFATDATDLEAALTLAQAAMPAGSRRRVVIITDGNETIGNATAAAARLAQSGIGIDVVPIHSAASADVLVEKIDLPGEIRTGQPLEARVVLNNEAAPGQEKEVSGRLRVTRRIGGEDQLLIDTPVQLHPGKNVFPLRHQIDQPAPYTYEARFLADTPSDDAIAENNTATAFTYVRGQGRVLLIHPWEGVAEYQLLVERLRGEDIEVVVQPSNATFGSLAELQAYDAVILAGVARVSGDSAASITSFTDEQLEMLVRNTQQLGCGLLMLGGPEAFGAGGWAGTAIESAMPVDFEIKNSKVLASGALMLVIDSSGSMAGEKMLLCQAAAREAVRALQPSDSIGIIAFDSQPQEIVPLQPVAGRTHLLPMINRISPGGGTDMFPAMEQAFARLRQSDASTKHMIVLTDGQTPDRGFRALTARVREAGITVTSVAIGADSDVDLMREIAAIGRGKLYHVLSARAVPRILMREARRVSRGLIHEDAQGFAPQIVMPHSILSGLETALPPLHGFVMTTPKQNPLVQTLLASPVPAGQENPLLAVWQYGLGRAAVLTTDAGARWASQWAAWPGYDKFHAQLVRWLMRPSGDTGKFSIATQLRDGQVHVVVGALDQEDEFLNFLPMNASVLSPELQPIALRLRQTAPGRYTGTFPAASAGNYFIHVVPDPATLPLTTAVTIPYSEEYRLRPVNEPLLRTLAATAPRGGEAGQVLQPLPSDAVESNAVESLVGQSNPYRGGLVSDRSIRDIWPWLVLCGCCLFFFDVLVRRVTVAPAWVATARGYLGWRYFGREPTQDNEQASRLESLRASKQRVHAALRRSSEVAAGDAHVETHAATQGDAQATAQGQPSRVQASPQQSLEGRYQALPPEISLTANEPAEEEKSYTERLLEAKRKAARSQSHL